AREPREQPHPASRLLLPADHDQSGRWPGLLGRRIPHRQARRQPDGDLVMKTLAFLALAMLWPLQANAEIVVVQAKGYGDTYEQAVESALGDAVKQVNGASVATRSASPKAYVQVKDAKETRTQGSADTSLKKETREGGIFHDTVTDNTDTAKSAFDNTTATSGKTALEIGVGSSNEVRSQGKVK